MTGRIFRARKIWLKSAEPSPTFGGKRQGGAGAVQLVVSLKSGNSHPGEEREYTRITTQRATVSGAERAGGRARAVGR